MTMISKYSHPFTDVEDAIIKAPPENDQSLWSYNLTDFFYRREGSRGITLRRVPAQLARVRSPLEFWMFVNNVDFCAYMSKTQPLMVFFLVATLNCPLRKALINADKKGFCDIFGRTFLHFTNKRAEVK